MTSYPQRWLVLLGALAQPACGEDGTNGADVFRQQLQQFQADVAAHQTNVDAATELSGVLDVESRFYDANGSSMNGMRRGVADMMGCMGGMHGTFAGPVLDDLDDLQEARQQHWDAIQAALDRDGARAEETRFEPSMIDLMGELGSHAQAILDTAVSRGCPHSF